MNEIQNSNIDSLTSEILILKQQTAQNIIEIGRRLIQVKENLPHGEWGGWLKEKVDFTDRTAQRFMRAAREFSNATSLSGLGSSKLFALLDLPQEEREEFISEPHEVEGGKTKTVDEMTTRELQKAIKEKKELESKLKKAEKRSENFEKEIQKIKDETKEKLTNSEVEITNLRLHIEGLNKKITTANTSAEVDKLHKELEESQNQLQETLTKVNDLEEQVKNKPIDLTYTDQLAVTKDETTIVKYKLVFEYLVDDFKSLLGTLPEMKESNPEEYEKYKGATLKLIDKMKESLI